MNQKVIIFFLVQKSRGGVTVTLWAKKEQFIPIGIFTPYPELKSILNKIYDGKEDMFDSIVSSTGITRFSNIAMQALPNVKTATGKGTGKKITSKIVEKLPEIFTNNTDLDKYKIIGISSKRKTRIIKYVDQNYIQDNIYLNRFKILLPKANGDGTFGETLSSPIIGYPGTIGTDTFMCIGAVKSINEANNILNYLKTKFLRSLLGIRKITQDNPKKVWKFIPLQDFTSDSDIDWSKSIPNIDKQLYKKYNLSEDEINFIETKVQVME